MPRGQPFQPLQQVQARNQTRQDTMFGTILMLKESNKKTEQTDNKVDKAFVLTLTLTLTLTKRPAIREMTTKIGNREGYTIQNKNNDNRGINDIDNHRNKDTDYIRNNYRDNRRDNDINNRRNNDQDNDQNQRNRSNRGIRYHYLRSRRKDNL